MDPYASFDPFADLPLHDQFPPSENDFLPSQSNQHTQQHPYDAYQQPSNQFFHPPQQHFQYDSFVPPPPSTQHTHHRHHYTTPRRSSNRQIKSTRSTESTPTQQQQQPPSNLPTQEQPPFPSCSCKIRSNPRIVSQKQKKKLRSKNQDTILAVLFSLRRILNLPFSPLFTALFNDGLKIYLHSGRRSCSTVLPSTWFSSVSAFLTKDRFGDGDEDDDIVVLQGPKEHLNCVLGWVESQIGLVSAEVDPLFGFMVYHPYFAGASLSPLSDRIRTASSLLGRSDEAKKEGSPSKGLKRKEEESKKKGGGEEDLIGEEKTDVLSWIHTHLNGLNEEEEGEKEDLSASLKSSFEFDENFFSWESFIGVQEEETSNALLLSSSSSSSSSSCSFSSSSSPSFSAPEDSFGSLSPISTSVGEDQYVPIPQLSQTDFQLSWIPSSSQPLISLFGEDFLFPSDARRRKKSCFDDPSQEFLETEEKTIELKNFLETKFSGSGSSVHWELSSSSLSLLDRSASAGCGYACRVSESLSFEVLSRIFSARLKYREKEVLYRDKKGGMVDYVCKIERSLVGVSVTRVVQIPHQGKEKELSCDEDVYYLLLKKLAGLALASQSVAPSHSWKVSLLFIWVASPSLHERVTRILKMMGKNPHYNEIFLTKTSIMVIETDLTSPFYTADLYT
mmetsp:Transcript_34496/g.47157  ORF Transcript_34496/g.47157 Transcript_34496/m.47157 type:complete len:674 (+) Transcript_34496:136-2157(+)